MPPIVEVSVKLIIRISGSARMLPVKSFAELRNILNHADSAVKRKVINTIKNHHDNKEKVNEIIGMVLQSGGIEYAASKMNLYKEEALQLLTSFPDSPSRRSLEELVDFTTARKK